MSTFDATSQSTHPDSPYDNDAPEPAPTVGAHAAAEPDPPALSTLDELRAAADEEDTREPITVTNPRDRIRLTLRTDFSQKDVQRWQFKSLPVKHRDQLRRRGGQPNLSALDPVLMFASAIAETTIHVEVRSRATGDWAPVVDQHTGDPLTFEDAALRQVLGGLDTKSAVTRAFNGSEPALLEAGQRLLDAAGYGDGAASGEGDGEDPTTAAG